jgi:hypothetical protein
MVMLIVVVVMTTVIAVVVVLLAIVVGTVVVGVGLILERGLFIGGSWVGYDTIGRDDCHIRSC